MATKKIKDFAKEVNMETKEVVAFFKDMNIEKTTQGSVEDAEIGKFLLSVSEKRAVSSLDDYIEGKIKIGYQSKVVEKPKEEPKKEEPKAEEKPQPKAEPKAEGKAQPTAEPKKEAPKAEERPQRPSFSPRPQGEGYTQRPNNYAQRPQGEGYAQRPNNYGQRPQGEGYAQRPNNYGQRPQGEGYAQRPNNYGQRPQGEGYAQRPNGFGGQRPMGKPSYGTNGIPFGDKEGRGPLYNPAPKVKIKQETNVVKQRTGATRIVDTRTSNVDLSKYDDNTDNYASQYERYGSAQSKQKLKKQNTKDPYNAKKEKERLALEKKKREIFEKAKNTQLTVSIPDEITVGELASRLKVVSGEVVKRLMLMGVMASVNQVIDFDAASLVADELGAKVVKEVVVTIEEKLFEEEKDPEESLVERAPVVCVMGHVDHGKTSLLDAIRHTNVTTGEAGGITQHIGAYRVNVKGKEITFLDTPGHEAFTAMRLRGAMATDIAIIVVAADDGIKPQTVEAINHAKAAGVDIIVAINKMDKPTANPDAVKQELTKYELVPEEWGGDVICVPVSALTKKGIDDLLENVLLVAEVKELKANPNRFAKGIIIESKLDKGRGPVATVLVQNGTLRSGDIVIAGTAVGRVRAMLDHNGKALKEAGPSVPVEIVGLDEVPSSGDEFNAVKDEKMARQLADDRKAKAKEEVFKANAQLNLDELFRQISDGVKEIKVIVKADVGGSCEAVKQALQKLSNDEVKINVIHTACGGITESDVMLASASNAIIVGFNVRPDKNAIDSAERSKVDIRTHRIIYEIIEEMEDAMKGMLDPTFKEVINGHAEVRQTIHVPNVGTIAGCYVQDGKITRSSKIRIIRDGVVIAEDKIASLKRFKDDAKEVAFGYECGVGLEKFNDIQVGDVFESFEMQEVER